MKYQNQLVEIREPNTGNVMLKVRRVIHNITRDEWDNLTGEAIVNGNRYQVSRAAYGCSTWFGNIDAVIG